MLCVDRTQEMGTCGLTVSLVSLGPISILEKSFKDGYGSGFPVELVDSSSSG